MDGNLNIRSGNTDSIGEAQIRDLQDKQRSRLGHTEVVNAFIMREWRWDEKPRAPHSSSVRVTRDFRVLWHNGFDVPLAFWSDDDIERPKGANTGILVVNGDQMSWGLRRTLQCELLESPPSYRAIIPFSTLTNILDDVVDMNSAIGKGKSLSSTRWSTLAQQMCVVDLAPEEWSHKSQVVRVAKKKMRAIEELVQPPSGQYARRRKGVWHFQRMFEDVADGLFGVRRPRFNKNVEALDDESAALDSDMHAPIEIVRNMKVAFDPAKRTVAVEYDRHSLGACLFYVTDKNRHRRYFLSARSEPHELHRHTDGYFLVELPRRSDSIADALASLQPRTVRGDHKRQGEFFFVPTRYVSDADIVKAIRPVVNIKTLIPVNGAPASVFEGDSFESFENYRATSSVKGHVFKVEDDYYVTSEPLCTSNPRLVAVSNPYAMCNDVQYICDGAPKYSETRTPQNYIRRRADIASVFRPNHGGNAHMAEAMVVSRGKKPRVFVKGFVFHSQHRPVRLSRWHEVFINTAKRSWSVNGRVD